MEKKNLKKDLNVLWISVSALVFAALNIYVSKSLSGSEES